MLLVGLGALEIALLLLSGLTYGRPAARKAASLVFAALALGVPWLLPSERLFFRGLFAVFSMLAVFKWLQAVVEGEVGTVGQRLWQWTAIFDVRCTERSKPRLDLALLGHAAAYAAVAALGTSIVMATDIRDAGAWVPRMFGGLLAVVGLVQAVIDLVRLVHALFGVRVPPIQREPLLASSVREFWGRRWNRTVSDWLRKLTFIPFARRGRPGLGVVAAFAVSALFHFYIVVVPLGVFEGMVMAAFFLAQIPLVFIERVALTGASRFERRVFAIFALLATSPLFLAPFNEILAGGPG